MPKSSARTKICGRPSACTLVQPSLIDDADDRQRPIDRTGSSRRRHCRPERNAWQARCQSSLRHAIRARLCEGSAGDAAACPSLRHSSRRTAMHVGEQRVALGVAGVPGRAGNPDHHLRSPSPSAAAPTAALAPVTPGMAASASLHAILERDGILHLGERIPGGVRTRW